MTDKWWGTRPAHPQDRLLIAHTAPQPLNLTSNQWERTGKLPPNVERLAIPRANLNPTFEVEGGAPVPVWPGKAWPSLALLRCGLPGHSQGCTKQSAQDSQSQVDSKWAQRGGGRMVCAVLSQGTHAILHSGKESVYVV